MITYKFIKSKYTDENILKGFDFGITNTGMIVENTNDAKTVQEAFEGVMKNSRKLDILGVNKERITGFTLSYNNSNKALSYEGDISVDTGGGNFIGPAFQNALKGKFPLTLVGDSVLYNIEGTTPVNITRIELGNYDFQLPFYVSGNITTYTMAAYTGLGGKDLYTFDNSSNGWIEHENSNNDAYVNGYKVNSVDVSAKDNYRHFAFNDDNELDDTSINYIVRSDPDNVNVFQKNIDSTYTPLPKEGEITNKLTLCRGAIASYNDSLYFNVGGVSSNFIYEYDESKNVIGIKTGVNLVSFEVDGINYSANENNRGSYKFDNNSSTLTIRNIATISNDYIEMLELNLPINGTDNKYFIARDDLNLITLNSAKITHSTTVSKVKKYENIMPVKCWKLENDIFSRVENPNENSTYYFTPEDVGQLAKEDNFYYDKDNLSGTLHYAISSTSHNTLNSSNAKILNNIVIPEYDNTTSVWYKIDDNELTVKATHTN